MRWSAEQMYDLVADVGSYAEFLPWVVATRLKSDSEEEMIADMLVGFSALREKFTSRVLVYRDHYAGFWAGADHGGHLFGRIERAPAESK